MRNRPKRTPKEGETLYMYTGLRTKECELIRKDLTLNGWQHIIIFIGVGYIVHKYPGYYIEICINERKLSHEEVEIFCKNDGFEDYYDLAEWFASRNKELMKPGDKFLFEGILYHWTDFRY